MRHFYVANSRIEGRGLIAGEDIPKGSTITRIKGPAKFKINKTVKDALAHPDWVGVKRNIWIDPLRPHKFLNHSCNPTSGMRGLTLIAIRDIKEGEEITADYSTFEGDHRWEMICGCGHGNCRKVIRSVQHLTPEQFNAIPQLPAYFKKLYLQHTRQKKSV